MRVAHRARVGAKVEEPSPDLTGADTTRTMFQQPVQRKASHQRAVDEEQISQALGCSMGWSVADGRSSREQDARDAQVLMPSRGSTQRMIAK
jgi:hypothetical protein